MNLPAFTQEICDLQVYTQQHSLRPPGCKSIVNIFLSLGDLISVSIGVGAGATPESNYHISAAEKLYVRNKSEIKCLPKL